MPDTTYRSNAIEALPTPNQFDVTLKLWNEKLDRRWLPKLRFLDWLKSKAKFTGNYNRPSVMWDMTDESTPYVLQQWGIRSEINAVEWAQRKRQEIYFDYQTMSMPRDEITKLQTGDVAFRNIFKMRFEDMSKSFMVKLRDKVTSGTGAEYTIPGGSNKAQGIRGYQSILATSYSGSYGQVAVSSNTAQQHGIVNGDAGPSLSFLTDFGIQLGALLRATCVDRNGIETQADTIFTGLAGLALYEKYMYLNGMTRLNFEGGKMSDPDLGFRGGQIQGVPINRDETLDSSKRFYALNSESWNVFSQFGGWDDTEMNRELPDVTGKDTIDIKKYALALVCDHLPSQGVLYYA